MGLHGESPRAFLRTTKRLPLAWMPAVRFAYRRGVAPTPTRLNTSREHTSMRLEARRRASNRSRKRLMSSAPLGHSLSGGLFFARRVARPSMTSRRWPKPHRGPSGTHARSVFPIGPAPFLAPAARRNLRGSNPAANDARLRARQSDPRRRPWQSRPRPLRSR